jgi:hypothetical protein
MCSHGHPQQRPHCFLPPLQRPPAFGHRAGGWGAPHWHQALVALFLESAPGAGGDAADDMLFFVKAPQARVDEGSWFMARLCGALAEGMGGRVAGFSRPRRRGFWFCRRGSQVITAGQS